MTHAQLTISLPDGTWVKDVTTTHPDATVRVLAGVPGDASGFALVRIHSPDLGAFLADMARHPAITDLTLIQRSDHDATVHFETHAPLLLFSAKASGTPIALPIEIQDGEATVRVTGSRKQIQDLAGKLESHGITYQVETIRDHVDTTQLLSDRQRELVTAAVEHGYYDTPRKCSLTDLATELGIAKSTCSETLHRAEETIIKHFLTEHPQPQPADSPAPLPRPRSR